MNSRACSKSEPSCSRPLRMLLKRAASFTSAAGFDGSDDFEQRDNATTMPARVQATASHGPVRKKRSRTYPTPKPRAVSTGKRRAIAYASPVPLIVKRSRLLIRTFFIVSVSFGMKATAGRPVYLPAKHKPCRPMSVSLISSWTVRLVMAGWLLAGCHKAPPVRHAIPVTPENSWAGISDAAGGAGGSVVDTAHPAKRPHAPSKAKPR